MAPGFSVRGGRRRTADAHGRAGRPDRKRRPRDRPALSVLVVDGQRGLRFRARQHLARSPRAPLLQPRRGARGVRRTASSRPPIARALMQADLWSAYDMLHTILDAPARDVGCRRRRTRITCPDAPSPLRHDDARAGVVGGARSPRCQTRTRPPRRRSGSPICCERRATWMEIRWLPQRSHDSAAGHRRATRVFVRPAKPPKDERAFLNQFREGAGR